jgi:hypothetical protein
VWLDEETGAPATFRHTMGALTQPSPEGAGMNSPDDIADIHGALASMRVIISALARSMPIENLRQFAEQLRSETEAARTHLLNTRASDRMLASMETHCADHQKYLDGLLESFERMTGGRRLPEE